jgi:heparan-alpha-glucosaminide N-acetyltransferase
VKQWRRWAFPLMVIGVNSIAAYLMAHLWERFFLDTFRIHLGAHAFAFLGTPYEPLLRGFAVMAAYWLALWWMYRRKLFLKI